MFVSVSQAADGSVHAKGIGCKDAEKGACQAAQQVTCWNWSPKGGIYSINVRRPYQGGVRPTVLGGVLKNHPQSTNQLTSVGRQARWSEPTRGYLKHQTYVADVLDPGEMDPWGRWILYRGVKISNQFFTLCFYWFFHSLCLFPAFNTFQIEPLFSQTTSKKLHYSSCITVQ